jgi:hypothetical protein
MDKIILICATGRSGSTTLQRIINTIPNSNICGENYGAINSLLEFYYRLKFTTSHYVPGNRNPYTYEEVIAKNLKPCWYNSYQPETMIKMIKTTITAMFKNMGTTNVWGFKEIRYDIGEISYINEFKELFPQTKVIIHVRKNIQKQSQSGFMKKDPKSFQKLLKANNKFHEFYQKHRDFCYFMTFEEMFDLNKIKEMFRFLDCEKEFSEEKIKEVLDHNLKD